MKNRVPFLLLALFATACSGGETPAYDALWDKSTSRVTTPTTAQLRLDAPDDVVTHQRPHMMDDHGRYVHMRGINVSGSHKAPPTEVHELGMRPSRYPLEDLEDEDCRNAFPIPDKCVEKNEDGTPCTSTDTCTVDYVGSPFPIEDADRWYGEMARLGFNSVRLITNWESIQPYKPGSPKCLEDERYTDECYDLEYLEYYEQVIAKAKEYGIYVLVDMHQDIFSRHLMVNYNETPTYELGGRQVEPERGTIEHILYSLLPPYTDWVRGHGAPRWVVQTCLPEKDLNSKYWGMFRAGGQLTTPEGAVNLELLNNVQSLLTTLTGSGEPPEWFGDFISRIPTEHFEPNETADILPLSPWVLDGVLSLDINRCFAALFAGDEVFPNLRVDTADGVTKHIDDATAGSPDLRTYLQGEYIGVYRQLAQRAKKYDHVIGYDVMNEPVGAFIMLAIGGLFADLAAADPDNPDEEPVRDLVVNLLGDELGAQIFDVIKGMALLPTDGRPETLAKWGIDNIDMGAALAINFGFEANYLQPFYENVGQAIQDEDPNAIIWFEPATSIRLITGPQRFWDMPLTRPQGIKQLVYAPHWYPDIYPRPGLNSAPRNFNDDEWLYRDFTEDLKHHLEEAPAWMGNIPVVFGEFGTYFTFNGVENAAATGYEISSHVLNSYYEAFETLGVGNMVWCFSATNTAEYGESWNHEDFSIIGPDQEPRAWPAYVRTYARATSGKKLSEQFNSQYHFWDPEYGERPPERHYDLTMGRRESDAPTEIFVPALQYPEGFYLWISDGHAYFDADRQVVYWYPTKDAPGTTHRARVEPHTGKVEALGWSYLFKDGKVLVGSPDPSLVRGGVDR